ncbi:MAG: hypothetical protein ABEJ65_08545 [bacterium]
MRDLVEIEADDGDLYSVWYDEEEELISVQVNFMYMTFDPDQFDDFQEAIKRAQDALESDIS